MERRLFLVFSNPVEGMEEAYDEWYDDHIDHLIDLDGFVSAERFRLSSTMGPNPAPYRYMVVYEVEGDGQAARESMRAGLKDGSIVRSEAIDWDGMRGWFFEPLGERKGGGVWP